MAKSTKTLQLPTEPEPTPVSVEVQSDDSLKMASPETVAASEPPVEPPLEEAVLSAEEERRQRVAELEAYRADLQQQLASVQQRRYAFMREELKLSEAIDKQTVEIDRLSAPQSTTESIQAYIARQNEIRAARVARKDQLLGAGVLPDELRSTAAPIDKKLAARRSTDRPKVAAVA